MPFFALAPVGAKTLVMTETMQPNKALRLDFGPYIGPTGRVLRAFYTANGPGNLTPARFASGIRDQPTSGTVDVIYPIPFSDTSTDTLGPTKLAIMILWVDAAHNDQSLHSLVQAFDAWMMREWNDAIIPANVAVEMRVGTFLKKTLSRVITKDRAENFLQSNASYSHQLNILLPLVCDLLHIPMLRPEISERLKELRVIRNQIGHDGKPTQPLSEQQTAQLLCAAVMGARYIDFVDEEVGKRVSNQRG